MKRKINQLNKKTMKKTDFGIIAILCVTVLTSCEKKDDPDAGNSGYKNGIFIVNEGAFNANNGSISFVDETNTVIVNDIFYAANGRPIGDIVQSFSVVNDSLGVIVVNHSEKLEFVRLTNFQSISEPLNVPYPRYFIQVNEEKGYLSSGSLAGKVYVLDLNSWTFSDSVDVGFGPEVFLRLGDDIYVANSGGWVSDSTLTVIDAIDNSIKDIVYVEKVPADMTLDGESNIWVYCKGYTNYVDIETESFLQKINPADKSILWQGKVGSALDYASTPAKCASSADGSKIYYIRPDGIYEVDAVNPTLAEHPLIPGNYYGLDVHPENGRIYVFESSFTGNGLMKVYEPDGTLFTQATVGVGPNGAVFNLR